MSKNNKPRVFTGTNMLLWICLLSSALFIGLFAAIDIFVQSYPKWLGLVLFAADVLFVFIVYIVYRSKSRNEASFKENTLLMEKAMTGIMKNVDIPCVLTLRSGLIAWCSVGANKIFEAENSSLLQKNFNEFSEISIEVLIHTLMPEETDKGKKDTSETEVKKPESVTSTINGRIYTLRLYRQLLGKNSYYLITFTDITDYEMLKAKTEAEAPIVAHIVLDNLSEIAEYVRVNYRAAANEIEEILKKFAGEMNGFIREYDRDKYILVFSKEKYNECASNKFDILETVRNVRLGDSSVPVTISMGISLVGDDFEEKERNSFSALEFALQRGGDQVAVKTEDNIIFFGGRTKSVQKKTSSFARVFATQLSAHIANAGNVLIMGHAAPDFDAVGACVGIARLCLHCGVTPKIIMNTKNDNFKACTEKLLLLDDYKNTFISAEAGLDLIKSDTLLIIVDANNFNILESPDIANNVANIVIIDHHRKVAFYDNEPIFILIDPSASSASEMVTELLEQCLSDDEMHKEEANVLLSGIMVDTKNFTRTTGTKTYSAAMYLRRVGANAEIANLFFREDFDHFKNEANFLKDVLIYRDKVAISQSEGRDPSSDRVAAAKTADKLLMIRNIEASFAIVTIGNQIHISARSNGDINVQLILEKLGGGGHFDSAAAVMKDVKPSSALYALKDAIDEYFEENT